ncbi:uncharacterized protein CIMG_08401 [Coccidioides immitis RS]|uniref:Uncharacterized protein n=1 Tax=Coccidioides immitis (strain RS) TaxID=246410 RepID=J3K5F6_COCIM|nr:uncharacterized protein CIMG_08401 [Coccidioides immitis RS]EAS29655.3 hypothetical protein CIMG_08401 [Coccidioides immitis RS]
MEGDLWKSNVKRHLNGLVQAFEQQNDSKALADYFRGVGNELDQTGALDFEPFQQFWYRHKRVVALQNVKKRLSTGTGNARSDASYLSRQRAETDFESDDVLSITDNWDMESSRLQEFKDKVQRSLRDDRDFFEPDQVNTPSNSGNELIEAEKAFTAAEKDANGAHRVFRLQLLALRLQLLQSEAAQHCGGSRIPMDKHITTYFAEKCWAHLDTKVRKEKCEKLARWRGYGEKWLALTEPAIVLAFGHILSDNRWFTEFEQRRFPIAAFNAVVGTLQAASIIHDLRKLWCLQLSWNHLSIRFHPEQCFCEGTDAVLSDGVTLSPEPLAERMGRHQRHGRVSDTDDVGNEQSSHESSPSSAAEHAPAENSVEAITPAEGTVIPQPLTPLIEMLHQVVPHDKRSESGQASASRRAEFSPENNTWTPGETASRPSADSNELQIRNETASVLNIESPGRNTGLSHDLHMGSSYNAGLPQSESGGSIDANTSLHPSNLIYSGNWDWNFNPMLDSWDQNYTIRPSLSEITQGNFSSWDQNYTLFE